MFMQVFSAQVIDGAIVADDDVGLPEGTRVTVLAGDAAEVFEPCACEEDGLLDAILEAERGDAVLPEEPPSRLPRSVARLSGEQDHKRSKSR